MSAFINLTGKVFGELRVLSRAENDSCGKVRWNVLCSCGNEFSKLGSRLTAKNSMGLCPKCVIKEQIGSKKPRPIKEPHHGLTYTKEMKTLTSMKQRCYNENNKNYHRYGGRGIKVCDRWLESIKNFVEDMGYAPSEDYSIDRIDNDGDYEPNNCRWVTSKEQANNKSNSTKITINGTTKTLAQWCEERRLNYSKISSRLHLGWSVDEAFGIKPRHNPRCKMSPEEQLEITTLYQSKNYSLRKLSLMFGVSTKVIFSIINRL